MRAKCELYDAEVEYRAFFIPGNGKSLPNLIKEAFLKNNARPKFPHWFV